MFPRELEHYNKNDRSGKATHPERNPYLWYQYALLCPHLSVLYTVYCILYILEVRVLSTTIRVSKWLAEALEEEKKLMGARSVEEVILGLLREKRRRLADRYFGIDKGRISRFVEEDRLDSRV